MVAESHENHLKSQTEKLKALVENISSYIEYYHGGFVQFVAFEDNVLKVRLGGACEGCPLSLTTLHGWVGGTVKQFFPDIRDVIAVEEGVPS